MGVDSVVECVDSVFKEMLINYKLVMVVEEGILFFVNKVLIDIVISFVMVRLIWIYFLFNC